MWKCSFLVNAILLFLKEKKDRKPSVAAEEVVFEV